MEPNEMKEFRLQYNKKLAEEDDFFSKFGTLDDQAYSEGAIDKKHKGLTGLAISVVTAVMNVFVITLKGA